MPRLENWSFEGDTRVVWHQIYLHEDRRKDGYRWASAVFSLRQRALRKAELAAFLERAGFAPVTFLPQASPWGPYEVVADRPS